MENNTVKDLEDALERILSGKPIRVTPSRKLSVSAVQAEAGLGVGSIYHYPDFVEKIKGVVGSKRNSPMNKKEYSTDSEVLALRNALAEEKRIKEKYRDELKETKVLLKKSLQDLRELSWKLHVNSNSKQSL